MGVLDDALRSVAESIVDAFVETAFPFKRVETTYNAEAGTELNLTTTHSIKCSPPFPFDRHFVDGQNILMEDLKLLVPAKLVEESGLDLNLGSNVQISVTVENKSYKVLRASKVLSGDLITLWELQLRR